jgi:tetratricopeptide (TPR) repeat protein
MCFRTYCVAVPSNGQTLSSSYTGDVYRRLGNFSASMDDLRRANELHSKDSFTLSRMAAIHYHQERHQEAFAMLTQADEQVSNDPFTITYLAACKIRLNLDPDIDIVRANETMTISDIEVTTLLNQLKKHRNLEL